MTFLKKYWIKVRHLLPSFLLIVIISTACFAIFRYIFAIQFHLIDTNEENWQLWLPIALPIIPALIWFRPRTRILAAYKDKDKDPRFAFQAICWGTAVGMMIFSQTYISTASGKLLKLSTADEITKQAAERYYQLNFFTVDTDAISTYLVPSRSGKHNQYFDLDYYVVLPLVSDTAQEVTFTHRYWYAVKYHKQFSGLSSSEEDECMDKYSRECLASIRTYDYHSLYYFERSQTSRDKKYFQKAISNVLKHTVDESYVILAPQTEPFEQRNGSTFVWIFISLGIGFGVLVIALLFPGLDMDEYERQLAGIKPEKDDLKEFMMYFVPRDEHFVTAILLDINILVYLAMILSGLDVVSPGSDELLRWGANKRAEVLNGDWWRLVTSMFLHSGFMHLAMNLFALYIAAVFIESKLGRGNYFILYLLSGICGSLASIWWHPDTVSVGASGAIFGLFGAILGLILIGAFPKDDRKVILGVIGFYVVFNLVWGMTGGIDNAAHIGGLLSGTILGMILYKIGGGGPLKEESDETQYEAEA